MLVLLIDKSNNYVLYYNKKNLQLFNCQHLFFKKIKNFLRRSRKLSYDVKLREYDCEAQKKEVWLRWYVHDVNKFQSRNFLRICYVYDVKKFSR